MKKFFLVCVLALFFAQFVFSQESGLYDDVINYNEAGFFKVDADGFKLYEDENVSLKWRAYIYLPDESRLFGFGPFVMTKDLVIEVKEITGKILVTDFRTDFDGKDGYKLVQIGEDFYRLVDDKSQLTVKRKVFVFSFLGNNMFEPPVPSNLRIGPASVNSVTIFLPKTMQIWDWSSNTGSVYKLNEHTIYSTNHHNVTVIYFDPLFKAIVQIVLALLTVVLVMSFLKWHQKIPKFNFKAKHFFALALIAFLLMIQLGFIVQNPNPINLDLRLRSFFGEKHLQYYLGYAIGITDSVNSLTIKNFNWCEPGVFSESRNIFLLAKSADKIYIPQNLKENPKYGECVSLLRSNVDDKKIELLSGGEKIKRTQPFFVSQLMFDIVRRIIYSLLLLTSFLVSAYIVLRAFEVKGLKNIAVFGLLMIVIAFAMILFNLITAFLAQMPVTYHGASTLPLTMSTKSLPFFNQAHIIRLVFLTIGAFFVFIFTKTIRRQISVRVFIFPLLVISLLLLLPQTEFSTKRAGLGFVCGNCGINYIGKLDAFDLQTIYKKVRDDRTISNLFETDKDELWRTANRLVEQKRFKEAADAYELYILTVEDATVTGQGAEAALKLAELYNGMREYNKAIEIFKKSLQLNPQITSRLGVLIGLANAYRGNGQKEEAISIYEEIEDTYSENYKFHAAESLFKAADFYQQLGDFESAKFSFEKLIKKYPESQYFSESEHRVIVLTEKLEAAEEN